MFALDAGSTFTSGFGDLVDVGSHAARSGDTDTAYLRVEM